LETLTLASYAWLVGGAGRKFRPCRTVVQNPVADRIAGNLAQRWKRCQVSYFSRSKI